MDINDDFHKSEARVKKKPNEMEQINVKLASLQEEKESRQRYGSENADISSLAFAREHA